jgi:hypothetical protein
VRPRAWRIPERMPIDPHGRDDSPETPGSFVPDADDLVILPLVVIAFASKALLQWVLRILIRILDYAFPLLLQLVRFPLFTLRILGDATVALLTGVIAYLPATTGTRDAWRMFLGRQWSRLRQIMSYRAFEEALHHAFEGGMAWVFRKCRTMTPRSALLTIIAALLWLPLSFGIATAMHAILIAEATSLPAWMQLLHPVATLIAKSKLLVLPVYPAAWPRAKEHPFVQATFRVYRYVRRLRVVRKARYRYWQTERTATAIDHAIEQTATRAGLVDLLTDVRRELGDAATRLRQGLRAILGRTVAVLSEAPLIGPLVRSYSTHYGSVNSAGAEKLSAKMGGLLARWSVNLSAEYYEAKERTDAAQRQGGKS